MDTYTLKRLKKAQDHLEYVWMIGTLSDEDKRQLKEARKLLYAIEMRADMALEAQGS